MCSSNELCSSGTCCDVMEGSSTVGACSSTTQLCYTQDGTLNVYDKCSWSSECATKCCDRFWGKCIAHTRNCQPNHSLPQVMLVIIVVVLLSVGVIGTIIGLIVCLKKRRNQKKLSVSTKKKKPEGPKRSETDLRLQESYPTEYFYSSKGKVSRSKSFISPLPRREEFPVEKGLWKKPTHEQKRYFKNLAL